MLKGKMELLAPAGGPEQMEYAIRFGADAVYLGVERFGMRARATNFALADLPDVVASAHARNVKVHLACNVVMHQQDIDQLPEFLEQAAAAKVDALIIGDMGAAVLARKHTPDVQIHVSTQASVSNAEAATAWRALGATRIVAAREMSLAEIADMKRRMPAGMELEAFAHGAMCMAYSGRCLISDFLAKGRSGVRGNCAQSCRWQYALVEKWDPDTYHPIEEDGRGTYILNAEDLCMLAHLDDLAAAGVDSIKIEGRNKKAYYVACVVNAYRQVMDGADPEPFLRELDMVSHRPYSTGFYYGPAHQTSEALVYVRKSDWAAEVLSCERDADAYRIEFRCRSRFALDRAFEVVSAAGPPYPVHMGNLVHIPASRLETKAFGPTAERLYREAEPYPVDEAEHPGERYYATVDVPVRKGDIIRMLR
ncbi:MAG: U32 family peptidase [Coriobacteriaceae bacterium]|nr:U32 family peptidase [Coriobacteriaceae bacterium]